ncbi:unnamed protein product [Dibothriocephalus latus]|uniref:Uncharacterized protein n=1 Tax=Dibothriocephalus latus TaxID=60516 RepID=A0A3P7QZI4_DIBLA|nr:unnamed protein product [Dibothriocephalus latus]
MLERAREKQAIREAALENKFSKSTEQQEREPRHEVCISAVDADIVRLHLSPGSMLFRFETTNDENHSA